MKPVRRRVRSHFGLTAKQVAVRSMRPWYFQTLIALLFVLLGAALAYWWLHDDDIEKVRENLTQVTLENKILETKLVGAQRELQVELATNNNLAKELVSVQDENLKLKAEVYFYKNMVGNKKPR